MDKPPTYDQTVHGESSTSRAPPPAAETVYGPSLREPDVDYVKSVPGILKIVQAAACLIGFIIDMTVYYPGSGFTSFSTISGFIQAVIWFILHLVHAIPQILANYYIEVISCSILALFLFIGFIVSAVHAWYNAAIGAVCFFVVVALVAYGIDVFLQVKDIRHKFAARQQGSTVVE